MNNADLSLNSAEPPNLRERKKQETRAAIRHAALDLAIEHGLDQLTVDMIAERVNISRRTFFNYFASKDDALIVDVDGVVQKFAPLLAQRPTDENVLHSFRVVLVENDPFALIGADRARAKARQALAAKNPELLARQLAAEAQVTQELAELIATRTHAGPQSIAPLALAGVANALVRTAVRRWAVDEGSDLTVLIDQAFAALEEDMTAGEE